jgi:hypothetical protein
MVREFMRHTAKNFFEALGLRVLPEVADRSNPATAAREWIAFWRRLSVDTNMVARPIEVESEVIDSPEYNAFAATYEGKGYIALYRGALEKPVLLLSSLLANPKCFPDLGEPTLESSEPKDELKPITISCPRRRHFHRLAVTFAWEFLFTHELSHILLGHCDWLASKAKPALFPEFRVATLGYLAAFDVDIVGPMSRQALELEADSDAATLVCSRIAAGAYSFPFEGNEPAPLPIILRAWSTAVATIFYLDDITENFSTACERSHPPGFYRAFALQAMTVRDLALILPDASKSFKGIWYDAVWELSEAVNNSGLQLRPVITESDKSLQDREAAFGDYADSLKQAHYSIIESLLPFTYSKWGIAAREKHIATR